MNPHRQPAEPSRPRPVQRGPKLRYVVFAQAKSGTTWLQRLLSAHPQVHCAESRLVGDFYLGDNPTGPAITVEKFVSGMLRHYHAPDPKTGGSQGDFGRAMLFNIIDAIATTAIEFSGRPIYGEKLTPYPGTAAACVRTLHDYNPAMCFVHLIRDGRDVIVSGYSHWANIRINAAKAAGKHDEASRLRADLDARRVPDKIVDDAANAWADNVAAGLDGERAFENSLQLKYEDLLGVPGCGGGGGGGEERFGQLFRAIGADASPTVVQAAVAAASFERLSGGRASGEEDRASFFRKGVAGDWQTWLTPEQVARFEARAGALMDRVGYPRSAAAQGQGAAAIDFPRVHTPSRQSRPAGTSPRSA